MFELRTILSVPTDLVNGDESVRIQLEIQPDDMERLSFRVPPYNSRVELEVRSRKGDTLTAGGTWTKINPAGEQVLGVRVEPWPRSRVDGSAEYAPAYPLEGEPLDISGRWRVQFARDAHPAVGLFEGVDGQPGEVRGTFLTTTGDYRYLAGTARGRTLALSCFDGAHAFLFRAELDANGGLSGDFWSGAKWHETWTAARDPDAKLPDAFGLNVVDPKVRLAELEYPALDGEVKALGTVLGRATLVQLFGTWCPNCGDAGLFLRELQSEYGARGLAVVGLAFEHEGDLAAQRERVAEYVARRGGAWPIFLAGSSDKRAASEALPVLDRVHAYPTTLFVDADGDVRAVYTGFSGPATGEAYRELQRAFRAHVERLLSK